MKISKKLALFLSFLLLVQSTHMSLAKREKLSLLIEPLVINGSVVDRERNVLVIKNAKDLNLSETVSIKPSKKTLAGGKATSLKGSFNEDGSLQIDLAKLGPPNLLPSGKYTIIATSNSKKIKGLVKFKAPRLVIGRMQIPISKKRAEKLKRIYKNQETIEGEESIPKVTVAVYSIDDLQNPINSFATSVDGEVTEINGETFIEYDNIITEVPPEGTGSEFVVKALTNDVEGPTGETDLVLTSLVSIDDENEGSNVTNIGDIDIASHGATVITAAASDYLEDQNVNFSPSEIYEAILNATQEILQLSNLLAEQQSFLSTFLQVHVNDITNAIIASQSNVQPQEAVSNALEISWRAPSTSSLPIEQVAQDFSKQPINTHAALLTDPSELPAPIPIELQAEAFNDAGAIVGAASNINEQEIINEVKENGTLPVLSLDSNIVGDVLTNLESYASSNAEFNIGEVTIPPGVTADWQELSKALPSTSTRIHVASGGILEGASSSGGVPVVAEAGAVIDSTIEATAATETYDGTSLVGLIPPRNGKFGLVPSSFAEAVTHASNLGIFVGEGDFANIQGTLFVLDPVESELSEPTTFLPSFDPVQQSSELAELFQNNSTSDITDNAVIIANEFFQEETQLPQTVLDITQQEIDNSTSSFTQPTRGTIEASEIIEAYGGSIYTLVGEQEPEPLQ